MTWEQMRSRFAKSSVSMVVFFVMAAPMIDGVAYSQLSRRDADALSNASLIYVATVRKDGNQSTAAPVWFTTTPDGSILIQTGSTSWKARRIRRGSPVIVWLGKADGPALIGKAEMTSDPAVINRIAEDYPKKYFLAWVGLHKPTAERFAHGQIVAIRIVPVRELPEGVASAPGTAAPKLSTTE
jgi:general stress protein 26